MLSRLIHCVRNGELDGQPVIILQNKALNLFHLRLLSQAGESTRNYITQVFLAPPKKNKKGNLSEKLLSI